MAWEKLFALGTDQLLAVALLLILFAGYKVLDYWLKGRLDAKKTTAEHVAQNGLHDKLAAMLSAKNRELAEAMTDDRRQLAMALSEMFDGRECVFEPCDFGEDEKRQLSRLHNSHLGDGTRRSDGQLRWHISEQLIEDAKEGRKAAELAARLAAEVRDEMQATQRRLNGSSSQR